MAERLTDRPVGDPPDLSLADSERNARPWLGRVAGAVRLGGPLSRASRAFLQQRLGGESKGRVGVLRGRRVPG